MHLTLSNFKCHRYSEYELNENGMTLLCGKSGIGKSTVLQALVFVLYGKVRKIKPHFEVANNEVCTVTLKSEKLGLTITRSKPINKSSRASNILKVTYKNTEIKDDPIKAQSIIDEVLAVNSDEFMVSSYFDQFKKISILSMAPADQLQFIETVASSETTQTQIKEAINDRIKKLENSYLKLTSQLELLGSQIKTASKSVNLSLKKDEIDVDPQELKKRHTKLSKVLNDTQNTLKQKRAGVKRLQEQQNLNSKQQRERDSIKTKVDVISQSRDELLKGEALPTEDEINLLKSTERTLQQKISHLEHYIEAQSYKNSYEEALDTFNSQINERIQNIKSQIILTDEIEKEIENYNGDCVKKLSELEKEYGKKGRVEVMAAIRSHIEEVSLLNLDDLECPCCKAKVRIQNNTLVPKKRGRPKKETHKSIETLAFELTELSKDSSSLTIEEYNQKNEILASQKQLLFELYQLEKERVPSHIENLIIKYKQKILGVPENFDLTDDLPSLKAKAKEINIEIEEKCRLKSEYSRLSREISNQEKALSKLGHDSILTDSFVLISEANQEIETLEHSLDETTLDITLISNQLLHIDELSKHAHLLSLKESYDSTQKEMDVLEVRLKAVYELKTSEKDAELIAVEKTINSINSYAEIYLQEMFDPIVFNVKLRIKRISKDGTTNVKPTIDLYIEYKGEIYDDLDELSGGERQKCELAFLFAVNDMMGSRIILLDECLNNLDGETNMEILNKIKELKTLKEKQVLIISHEAIHGVFDHILDFDT